MSVPITLRYFDPSGFFANLGATYVTQEVEDRSFVEGSDDFVTVDAAIGYRLPRRLGIISLGIRNLLDEEFSFQDDSFRTPNRSVQMQTIPGDVSGSFSFIPDRIIFGAVTLSF